MNVLPTLLYPSRELLALTGCTLLENTGPNLLDPSGNTGSNMFDGALGNTGSNLLDPSGEHWLQPPGSLQDQPESVKEKHVGPAQDQKLK